MVKLGWPLPPPSPPPAESAGLLPVVTSIVVCWGLPLLLLWLLRPRGEDAATLRQGTWASDRASYGIGKGRGMAFRRTFMPMDGDASRNRRRALQVLLADLGGRTDCADRDLYTFGVYTGASIKFWLERLAALKVAHGPMWGFDSFEGLPEEAAGVALEGDEWKPGGFSAADQFGVYTYGEVRRKIADFLGPAHAAKTRLVKGYFCDSLTPTLVRERRMQPALLIDVDVDLYISAYQSLDWCFAQGVIAPGTVVYYDDVEVVKADKGGELRAHEELTRKYGVTWRHVHDSCWVCVSVRGAQPDPVESSPPSPALALHGIGM